MNNKWNQIIYKCWAPFYDLFFNRGLFYTARKRVFEGFAFADHEDVLFVGVGTGADLAFCPLEKIHPSFLFMYSIYHLPMQIKEKFNSQ
jgi:phosphatidylethanolamine/phosphatidyl-N-methylethanolamine N-methyltransferase